MPPLLAQFAIRHRAVHLRLWVPLFLLWLLLFPLALIVLLIASIAMVWADTRPVRIIAALFGALSAVSGSMIDIELAQSAVFVRFV